MPKFYDFKKIPKFILFDAYCINAINNFICHTWFDKYNSEKKYGKIVVIFFITQ
jgi:hypothetical protein